MVTLPLMITRVWASTPTTRPLTLIWSGAMASMAPKNVSMVPGPGLGVGEAVGVGAGVATGGEGDGTCGAGLAPVELSLPQPRPRVNNASTPEKRRNDRIGAPPASLKTRAGAPRAPWRGEARCMHARRDQL